jgi:hypothetical protein
LGDAHRGETRDGGDGDNGDGSARTAVRGTFGQGRADTAGRGGDAREAAVGRSGRAALSEAARRRRGNAVGTRGRAVPTAALIRCVDAAHGGHAAVALCRAGPVRPAMADKWGPLISDFQIKIYPEEN